MANEDESLHLTDTVRLITSGSSASPSAPTATFLLYEEAPGKADSGPEVIQAARPLTPKGSDADGHMLFEATVVYGGAAFKAVFSVLPDGALTMADDGHWPSRSRQRR